MLSSSLQKDEKDVSITFELPAESQDGEYTSPESDSKSHISLHLKANCK